MFPSIGGAIASLERNSPFTRFPNGKRAKDAGIGDAAFVYMMLKSNSPFWADG